MPVPRFSECMLPVLRLSVGGVINYAEAIDRISDEFALTDEERNEPTGGGTKPKIDSHVYWSFVYLFQAGLLTRPRPGHYELTQLGEKVLENPPEKIDLKFLMQFEGYRNFQSRRRRKAGRPAPAKPTEDIAEATPHERVEAAFDDMNDALQEDLLKRILELSPASFGKLISDLMRGLGYKVNESGGQLKSRRDGGIERTINQDALGLDVIHLWARRYDAGHSVGVEDILKFAGALDDHGTTKGVFVTTGRFHPDARGKAESSPKHLALIDGDELTRLLVKHDVAVRGYRVIELKKIDEDYFDDTDA